MHPYEIGPETGHYIYIMDTLQKTSILVSIGDNSI